ncbi:MAG: NADP-dependent isocitrate dehydrogenase, partial [Flavobacteriales bacterium]|nr:NADP-dependent isocitrate dehydrogenase [Flavobacteriales bacterium]
VRYMPSGGAAANCSIATSEKHVQQFNKENHLRWDSLGEFLALGVSLAHLGETFNNQKALILGEALDEATSKFLENNKSPSRVVGELDNRGSHFYLTKYWAQELANQTKDTELQNTFSNLANELSTNESIIVDELISVQGCSMDIGGYYDTNEQLKSSAMRPSATFNSVIDNL